MSLRTSPTISPNALVSGCDKESPAKRNAGLMISSLVALVCWDSKKFTVLPLTRDTLPDAPNPFVPELSNTSSEPILKLSEDDTTSISSMLPDLISLICAITFPPLLGVPTLLKRLASVGRSSCERFEL